MWYRRYKLAQKAAPPDPTDQAVQQTNHIDFVDNGPDTPEDKGGASNPYVTRTSPILQGYEARLHSPQHTDPTLTTMEEMLQTARHGNNSAGNPSANPSGDARGDELIRGVPQAQVGQNQFPTENHPSSFSLN